ncbi:hypothetical protein HW555_014442 [Spodoptera exigua]|uniref:aspartate kinase n=1 Tax=Spodoptera exigua TaxID=7107 RepID=A0A835G3I0_SPOEX|nr:hypothetical protein HW555_014442 [Spodoptera exigua]
MKKLLELGVKKVKVIKFGGSSLASAAQLKKVLHIVKADVSRKFVVVSAPGKRSSDDIKVTDLLIAYYHAYTNNENTENICKTIVARYEAILDELAINKDVLVEIQQAIRQLVTLPKENNPHLLDAFLASGEDNNAKLVAAFFQQNGLNARYKNPKDLGIIVSDEPGNARILTSSLHKINQFKTTEDILVIPGFFGYTETGEICTFSRGGSDITGSIVAAGVGAEIYENFTDVNGIFVAHPGIVSEPKTIKELTYREMRELAYAGFAVLHDEALMPAYRANIPVVIKNTNNPDHPGTLITTSRKVEHEPVVGIASDQGFASIYISKYLMNRELGFGRRLLQILEELGLSYEHMPSGIDDISIILREKQLSIDIEEQLMERLEKELEPDELRITHGLSLLMIVGEGMRQRIGVMADSAQALADNRINLEMINQGSSELTASEYWDLIAAAYELNLEQKQARLNELATLFDMLSHQEETLASFSHGMRQKTIIIGALLPDPEIWILDEPLQGLDPQAAFDLKEMMKAHAAKGNTVIFSTHALDTAQQLCDELAILKKGELIYNGSVETLLEHAPNESLETIYLKMAGRQSDIPATETIVGESHE